MKSFLEQFRFANVKPPVADVFAGTAYSVAVNLSKIQRGCFVVLKGAGATGTSTITVEALSGNSVGVATPIEFSYRRVSSDNTTIGAVTKATTEGFVTTAAGSDLYAIEVDAAALASLGFKFVRVKAVESVDGAVLAGILFIGGDLRHADDTSDIVTY